MFYGPVPFRKLPKQDADKIQIMASRFSRYSAAMEPWSKPAKECTDFFEGRQWTADQIAKLAKSGRPALTFNKIAPLVRLTTGYMRNNRTDIRYFPANEGGGTETVGATLTSVAKQISEANQLPWVDAEVFLDGLVTGRAYYETRLNFRNNDLGEIEIKALDPFTVYLDPDAQSYDLQEHPGVMVTKWMSPDEIETNYGPEAAKLVRPFVGSEMTWGGYPYLDMSGPEVTPVRGFGQTDDVTSAGFRDFFHEHLVDRYRKAVRVIDHQHRVTTWGPCFIDLETGIRVPVPPEWSRQDVAKAMYHAEQLGNPVIIQNRPYDRVRWTVMVGDVLVHDDWSIHDNYTITGYFPYFRRGVTRGMVEDLRDPQREINKRRTAEIEIVSRAGNGGWLLNRDSLTNAQADHFKRNSSTPGFIGEYRGDPTKKPERIDPSPPPMAMERLEKKSEEDLRVISGINESALGELDRVQSGKAIEARQRQAVIAIQMYMDNLSRSKELLGRRILEGVQRHYREERVFRIRGEDGKLSQVYINQQTFDDNGTPQDRINDITLGKYSVSIDETPISASFLNAQFEELLALLEKMGPVGQMLAQQRPDLLLRLSSLPHKEEMADALKQAAAGLQPPPPGGGAPVPPGGGQPVAGPELAANGSNVVPLQPGGPRAVTA